MNGNSRRRGRGRGPSRHHHRHRPFACASIEPLESRRLLAVTGLPIGIGGAKWDSGKRIAVTPDGGFVVAGLFSDTVDFDPGPGVTALTSAGDTDIFVAKYSSTSALQWVHQIGSTALAGGILGQNIIDIAANPRRAGTFFYNGVGSDPRSAAEYVGDLGIAPDGGIVLVGSFIGSVDFNPGPGLKIMRTFDGLYPDVFVLKLTSSGDYFWADQFGGRFTDVGSSVAFDSAGDVFVGGMFSRTVAFVAGNPSLTLTAGGRADGFVLKLSPTGRVRWAHNFGGAGVLSPDRDAVNDIAVDGSGNVLAVGTYVGVADVDPSLTSRHNLISQGGTDGFVVKLTNLGQFVNAVSLGSLGYDGLTSIAIDSSNNAVFSGYFEGASFDADPGSATATLRATPLVAGTLPAVSDVFVEKLDQNLNFQWVRQLAGSGYELAEQLAIDSQNNVVLSGSFYGTALFGDLATQFTSVAGVGGFADPNDTTRLKSYDPFLWKMDGTTAQTLWVQTFGGVSDDFGTGISIAPDDSILQTGRFRGLVNFRTLPIKRLRGVGIADAFVTGFDTSGHPLF